MRTDERSASQRQWQSSADEATLTPETAATPRGGWGGQVPLPSLGVLVLLALGFRLTAFFLIRYGGFSPDWSDFNYYHELAAMTAQGFYPDLQFWVEYPPVLPWLAVGAYKLSLVLPPWSQPLFWFEALLTAVLAVVDAGTIVVIDRLGDAYWGPRQGRRVATIYAALFLPTFAIIAWFDTIPTFCLLLALLWLVRGRPQSAIGRGLGAGAAAGIGAMLKLFPLLALPAAVVVQRPAGGWPDADGDGAGGSTLGQAARLRLAMVAGVGAVLTIGIIAAPFLWLSPVTFLATFRSVLSRGSWMSPWAILDGYYGTGGVASFSDRLFYNASAFWGQPSRDGWLWWLAVALAGALYAWRGWAALRAGTPRAAIALTGFAVCLLLLVSKGFSQQYTIWLLPFLALALPGLDGALLMVVLSFNDLILEGYLYVSMVPSVHQLLWVTAGVRTLLLLWAAVELAVAIQPVAAARWWRVRRVLALPVGALGVSAVAVSLVLLAPAVEAAMLQRNGAAPAASAFQSVSPAAAVVLTQPDVYDRLYAVMQPRPVELYSEPKLLTWTGAQSLDQRMTAALAGHSEVLLVTDSAASASPVLPAVREWLGARYGAAPDQKVGSLTVTVYRQSLRPPEQRLQSHFGPAIQLLGYQPASLVGQPGQPLSVTLQWQTSRQLNRDYTISLQLLDPQNRLVAQRDAMPVNNTRPTSTWAPGSTVYDPIDLPLPKSLPAGQYPLIVVVYDHQNGQRLTVQGPGAAGDHAVLGQVSVR